MATRVKPGGRVVFAVCSVLPEEGERVVEAVSDIYSSVPFDLPEAGSLLPSSLVGPSTTMLRLLPLRDGCDGFFVASLERKR